MSRPPMAPDRPLGTSVSAPMDSHQGKGGWDTSGIPGARNRCWWSSDLLRAPPSITRYGDLAAAVERPRRVQLVDAPHQRQVLFRLRHRLVLEAGAVR